MSIPIRPAKFIIIFTGYNPAIISSEAIIESKEVIMSVLIKGGTVVTADQALRTDVLCVDGKIQQIAETIDKPGECEEIDAGGHYIMPIWSFGIRRPLKRFLPKPIIKKLTSIFLKV